MEYERNHDEIIRTESQDRPSHRHWCYVDSRRPLYHPSHYSQFRAPIIFPSTFRLTKNSVSCLTFQARPLISLPYCRISCAIRAVATASWTGADSTYPTVETVTNGIRGAVIINLEIVRLGWTHRDIWYLISCTHEMRSNADISPPWLTNSLHFSPGFHECKSTVSFSFLIIVVWGI